MSTREPVRILYVITAALSAFLGIAGLTEFLPERVIFWLGVTLAVLTAVGGEIARRRVTPVSDPRDDQGHPLVPATRLYRPPTAR